MKNAYHSNPLQIYIWMIVVRWMRQNNSILYYNGLSNTFIAPAYQYFYNIRYGAFCLRKTEQTPNNGNIIDNNAHLISNIFPWNSKTFWNNCEYRKTFCHFPVMRQCYSNSLLLNSIQQQIGLGYKLSSAGKEWTERIEESNRSFA